MSFDTQLKDRLESAASSMPGEPLDLVTTLRDARRSRRNYMAAVAVAAVLVVAGGVIAAVTLGDPPAPGKTIAPEPQMPDAVEQETYATVGRFLDAINIDGERAQAEAMWAFFSPNSKAYFDNDVNNFDPVSFNGETLGAYALAEDREMFLSSSARSVPFHRPVLSSDNEYAGVVTVSGMVTREGTTEWDSYALPVRIVDGETTIELFSDAQYPAAVTPDIGAFPPETLSPGVRFSASVPETDIVSMTVSIHGVRTEFSTQGDAQPGYGNVRWSWTPNQPLDAGQYVVTFAVTSETGGLAAAAEPFVVE